MSGEIKHEWSGTILTVISDSGASSVDLQGPKGDTGPRGPQGPAGILVNKDGEIAVDLSPYYTGAEVDAKIDAAMDNVDLEGYATQAYVIEKIEDAVPEMDDYATKNYVSTEIAKAQLSGGGGTGDVDLSGYATKDDLANITVDIDNKTIVRTADGKLRTALGGGEYISGNMIFTSLAQDWVLDTNEYAGMTKNDYIIGNSQYDFENGKSYLVVITWADGTQTSELHANADQSYGDCMQYTYGGNTIDSRLFIYSKTSPYNVHYYRKNLVKSDVVSLSIYDGEIGVIVDPINAKFVPVDGETIIVNASGKLTAVSGGVSMDGYYTKAEIDALLAQIETYPSAEEVEY